MPTLLLMVIAGSAERIKPLDLGLDVIGLKVQVHPAGPTFGSGYKDRPKSDAGIRRVPLGELAAEAVARQLPPDRDPDALAFTGPGGGNGVARGERTPLSPGNRRRTFKDAGTRAHLTGLALKGPHDLRHTFATWLEDAGLPTRVIDEVMGHRSARQAGERGSAIGVVYRHTTREMEIRIARAVDERLEVAQRTAASVWAEMARQQADSGRPTAPRRPRHAKSAAG